MGLFDWLPGYRTPNIFDAIEFIDCYIYADQCTF